jgi:hypothetical protein
MQYTSLSALCINTLLTNLFQSGKVTISPQQTVASYYEDLKHEEVQNEKLCSIGN